MTDQHLLESAAKAARIGPVLCYESARNCLRIGKRTKYTLWRPITDNADAFDLAVRLAMTVMVDPESKEVTAIFYCGKTASEPCTDRASALVATRRAIVRCAAEAEKVIGRAALGETKREG